MIRIINYKTRQREDGTDFYLLEVQGGIEMVLSKTSGQYYATAKKATVSTTFDEETCKALIGTEMPGSIEKVECQPFEYVIKETGEVINLHHRYRFVPELPASLKEEQAIKNLLGNDAALFQKE